MNVVLLLVDMTISLLYAFQPHASSDNEMHVRSVDHPSWPLSIALSVVRIRTYILDPHPVAESCRPFLAVSSADRAGWAVTTGGTRSSSLPWEAIVGS